MTWYQARSFRPYLCPSRPQIEDAWDITSFLGDIVIYIYMYTMKPIDMDLDVFTS